MIDLVNIIGKFIAQLDDPRVHFGCFITPLVGDVQLLLWLSMRIEV